MNFSHITHWIQQCDEELLGYRPGEEGPEAELQEGDIVEYIGESGSSPKMVTQGFQVIAVYDELMWRRCP